MRTRKPCPGCGLVRPSRPVNCVCYECVAKLKEVEYHRRQAAERVCEWATIPTAAWNLGCVPHQPSGSAGPNMEFLELAKVIAKRDPSSGVYQSQSARITRTQTVQIAATRLRLTPRQETDL